MNFWAWFGIFWVVFSCGVSGAVYIAGARSPVRDDEGDLYRARRLPRDRYGR